MLFDLLTLLLVISPLSAAPLLGGAVELGVGATITITDPIAVPTATIVSTITKPAVGTVLKTVIVTPIITSTASVVTATFTKTVHPTTFVTSTSTVTGKPTCTQYQLDYAASLCPASFLAPLATLTAGSIHAGLSVGVAASASVALPTIDLGGLHVRDPLLGELGAGVASVLGGGSNVGVSASLAVSDDISISLGLPLTTATIHIPFLQQTVYITKTITGKTPTSTVKVTGATATHTITATHSVYGSTITGGAVVTGKKTVQSTLIPTTCAHSTITKNIIPTGVLDLPKVLASVSADIKAYKKLSPSPITVGCGVAGTFAF